MLEMVREGVHAAQPVALLAEWYACPDERGQLAVDMAVHEKTPFHLTDFAGESERQHHSA